MDADENLTPKCGALPVRSRKRRTWRALISLVLAMALAPAAFGTQIRDSFDHLTTGFELLGQHRDLSCESCHANAVFKGTPHDCSACHGVGTAIRATAKTANHILSTERCDSCHTPVSWKPAVNFDHAEARGSCSTCHNSVQAQGKGPQHIDTDLECDACHSTLSWAGAVFNHSGVTTGCASCHNGVQATGMPANHIPPTSGGPPCESCHSTTNFTTFAGTKINHDAVATFTCQSCHETASYLGMTPSTATAAGDSRPRALDKSHPTSGDCGQCHDTSSFTATAALRPANHIPTSAPCAQCHTTPGQNAVYSVTGVHQGVTECLSCHGSTVATTFANVTIVSTPGAHIPIGSLDCNGSGCHSSGNVSPGGFNIGAASITSPTLNTAGHSTVAAAVPSCQTCHQAASFLGMLASTSTAGDSRPSTALDANHPAAGDCGGCHTTTPTFAGDVTSAGKPSNHIPTSAPCAQCHTTPGNYTAYSVTGVHQGVTECLSCHGPTVAGTFINVTIKTTPGNHIPTGSLDCNGSGCHSTSNVNTGGFVLGAASITSPTLSTAGHSTVAAAVPSCQTCHQAASFLGMLANASTAGDSRPSAALDAMHPAAGDCGSCHTTTPTFANDVTSAGKPTNHIPTNAACAQCHTTAGNYTVYSVTGTHQGVTNCLSCHGPTVATTFANVTIKTTPGNHIPIGSLDCNGSGCHSATNVNTGGFVLGAASINSPTLNVAGHTTVTGAVGSCQTCHETAPYLGMLASTSTAGDSRPSAALDAMHPTTADCGGCHLTTPTFASDVVAGTKPPNHIPTTAPCTQCHTTAGNLALYSVTGTHQGVTNCLSCHGPTVAATFVNVTITTTSANHIPIGSLDCAGSGCHTTTNVNPGGFSLGSANIGSPTLNTAGHATVAAAVASCQTCHETSPYQGMIGSSASIAGDSRPTALDKNHPTTGDCGSCHTTTPTFGNDVTSSAKPSNHIPTNAPCAQCHTTAGNYAVYSVTGTHQGVTNCLSCHGATVATTFANVTITTISASHIPIGSLDCAGSGCHTTSNVNTGGFHIGSANISSPTLNTTGHATVAAAAASCQTCHESAPYQGMIASSSSTAGDSRPTALDRNHPTTGDCGSCHTTTPTFAGDVTTTAKPSNHVPTGAPCAQCHTTAGSYAVYSVTGTHQGVTNCLSCHGPTVAATFANVTITTTTANHIPISSLDCAGSGCHTTSNVNPGGFVLGSASISSPTLNPAGHSTVAAAVASCQTCHETSPYQGMIASTATTAGDSRPTAFDKSHPTTGDCGSCHTATPTFASNVTNGSKPSNHIPTNAPCAQCHTTPGNYAAYVMGTTGHTGITSGCAICHADGLSFANMAPPALVEPPTGPTGHVPVGSLACELCHSVTNFTTFSGTVMKHAAVRANKCDSCHELGMTWKTNTGVRLWVRAGANHHPGQDCGGSGCHTSRDKHALRPAAATVATKTTTGGAVTRRTGISATARAGATLGTGVTGTSHQSVIGTRCASCHSQASGAGKPASHIAASDSCQSCHTTLAWLPVSKVDHTQVTGACASCHDGSIAKGKPTRHVATASSCENCHTTNAWTPARFDHAAVAPHTCITCHNAVRAIGPPRNHVPTSQQCDMCHGTLGWLPAKLDHSTIRSGCATCHNNTIAVGKPATHMIMQRECATCHTYPDWSLVSFKHASVAYPGDHRAALTCAACHTSNADTVPYSSPANAGACAGCHTKDFKLDAHLKTARGDRYTANELRNCSGSCHVYADSTLSTVTKSVPGPHHRVTDATFKH